MIIRTIRYGVFLLSALVVGDGLAESSVHSSREHVFAVEVVTDGLNHPWGMQFLPDGRALVTERPGDLLVVDLDTGARRPVAGVPEVAAEGQGGLLDVVLHPDFAENGWVYLSYAGHGRGGRATHVNRFAFDGQRLTEPLEPFVAGPPLRARHHFGSRLVFGQDGYLYVSTGDRGERDRAQRLDDFQGVTARLNDDLTVPEDNPFVGREDAEPAIFSYGHRNIQGMTVHPETGRIWQAEHGPRGGDEINLLVAGANYGWPLESYGGEYRDGSAIGAKPGTVEGVTSPIYYWTESFSPSGITVYHGEAFPDWYGDVFVGSLVRQQLVRLTVEDERITGAETLLGDSGWRIRDVRTGPDGYLYLLVDAASAPLLRIRPAES